MNLQTPQQHFKVVIYRRGKGKGGGGGGSGTQKQQPRLSRAQLAWMQYFSTSSGMQGHTAAQVVRNAACASS
eukprot:1152507-Pelagomonas_calceolata.AAC.4